MFDITTQGKHRLDRLGDQRLQRVALERHAHAGHGHDDAGVAGGDDADLLARAMKPRVGLDAGDARRRRRGGSPVTSQFWMMSTPQRVGAARIAPGDRVVARGAAAALQRGAERPDSGRRGEMLSGGQNAFACSGVSHSLSMPFSRLAWTWRLKHLHVVDVVRQHHARRAGENMTL